MKGLKTIEWLKAELLSAVGDLFRGMLRGAEDVMLDSLAHIVLASYLLARRLGFGFTRLDLKVEDHVQAHLRAGHEVEQWYGDLSALLRHLREGRRDRQRDQVTGDVSGPS